MNGSVIRDPESHGADGCYSNRWCLNCDKQSPLDCKDIQPVHPKGHCSCVFLGRTDVEAVTPILWPPDVTDSFEKTLMLGKIEGRRRRGGHRKGMVGWHHRLDRHEFE